MNVREEAQWQSLTGVLCLPPVTISWLRGFSSIFFLSVFNSYLYSIFLYRCGMYVCMSMWGRLHIHVCIGMCAYVCVEVRGQGQGAYFWRQGLFCELSAH